MSTTITDTATGPKVELGRYETEAGERVLIGRRIDGTVQVYDYPLGGGRPYFVERGFDSMAELAVLVADYRYPVAARLLTSTLLVDLIGISAARQRAPRGGVVLIDEFGAVAADLVSRLFARSRGAGISMILGTQTLADLRAVGEGTDVLTEQVISNVAYTVAHRIPDPDSAERLARMAGTQPAWTRAEQLEGGFFSPRTGAATRRRERDFVVGPDAFKRLPPGKAIVINPTASPPAEVVAIWPPEPEGCRRDEEPRQETATPASFSASDCRAVDDRSKPLRGSG